MASLTDREAAVKGQPAVADLGGGVAVLVSSVESANQAAAMLVCASGTAK